MCDKLGLEFPMWKVDRILEVLDECCDACTFPMLDNGYVYLAASRLSLFRSPEDWAMVIEVFGFSPREEVPNVHIYTFASRLHDRNGRDRYVSDEAYENYLANNPHNESRFVHPFEGDDWQDENNAELVARGATNVLVRGRARAAPPLADYESHGIALEERSQVRVFELCRYLASSARDDVLATASERRISVRPELVQLLQLDEWNHPNVVDDAERPSCSPAFQQLASVLVTGDVGLYRPTQPPNTHWRNWPDGGTL
jgi:hypothetical protein